MKRPLVFIHGGATRFKEEFHNDIIKAVERAAKIGFCTLERGGSGLDAAEAAIRSLEATTLFTAGKGAEPNLIGDVELDSMIMDGNRLESGAVMAVKGITHPISLARYVLERTPVMQIAGDSASWLYRQMIDEGYRDEEFSGDTKGPSISEGCDTVGCIVVDKLGRITSASSTSGWRGKLPGRVGDSAIIGAGVYANEVAGASCTGKGEQILRIVMGRMAVYYVEEGFSVVDSCNKIMRVLREKTTGQAGLIMADKNGNVGLGFDTPHMPIAIANNGKVIYSSMAPHDFVEAQPI